MKNILLAEYEKYGLFTMALFLVVATLPNPVRIYSVAFGVMALLLRIYISYIDNEGDVL